MQQLSPADLAGALQQRAVDLNDPVTSKVLALSIDHALQRVADGEQRVIDGLVLVERDSEGAITVAIRVTVLR
jgi:hypothetical protein